MDHCDMNELVGKILDDIAINKNEDEIVFKAQDGSEYKMFHEEDCCEHVYIEDICGDLDDLIGSPILLAEEVGNDGKIDIDETPNEGCESWTWTFYKLATNRGSITIRWLGRSNGYYSESVSFIKVK